MCRSKTYELCRPLGCLHTFACGTYLAFDLSHPRRFKFSHLTLTPDIRPRSAPSAVMVEAQPFQSPTQQRPQVVAESTPESAVPVPVEPSSTPIEVSSSPSESPPGVGIESTPVWAPLVAGILSGLAGNFVAETPSKPEENPISVSSQLTPFSFCR
jgi:hypothetical protein